MRSFAPDQRFLIIQGVHRSVAAREVGLPGVLAEVHENGIRIALRVVGIDNLVTAKASIGRWDRERDFRILLKILGTAAGRASLAPVIVEPISVERAARFIALRDVAVLEAPEEEDT